MLDRDAAIEMLKNNGATPALLRHALASEAVLAALAERLDEDPEAWARTGLLHDVDYPHTEAKPAEHGLTGASMLAGQLPEASLAAIRSHNGEMNGCQPETRLDFALRCGESVTGLIAAAALMRPTGYEGMETKSIKKKMKDKAFAAAVNRDNIRECSRLGLELDEFLAIAIRAMASVPELAKK